MTSRTDIATTLARAANPVERETTNPAWADAEGRAAFERILADPRTEPATVHRPRPIRRRLIIGAGLAGVAGAAVAIVGLPGASDHGTPSAWAVTKNANGSVTVTVRDYHDLAGLQAKLRAAGIRADVTTISDSCAGSLIGGVVERAVFNGDLSTFTDGHTWQRLFAGSEDNSLTEGPTTMELVKVSEGVPTAPVPTSIFPHPYHISFTVNPNELPPADTINIGFPADGSPAAGKVMVVDVEKTGAPINCAPPVIAGPPTTPAPPS